MSLSMEFLGSEIQQSITFSNAANLNADFIISEMESVCKAHNIQAVFQKDTVTTGGFFNKKSYACVIIRHPNPPQEYAHQVYVIAGNTIMFRFWGNSKAFREKNEYEEVRSGQGNSLLSMKYMFKQPDKMAYEVELSWHGQVIGAFNSLLHD